MQRAKDTDTKPAEQPTELKKSENEGIGLFDRFKYRLV